MIKIINNTIRSINIKIISNKDNGIKYFSFKKIILNKNKQLLCILNNKKRLNIINTTITNNVNKFIKLIMVKGKKKKVFLIFKNYFNLFLKKKKLKFNFLFFKLYKNLKNNLKLKKIYKSGKKYLIPCPVFGENKYNILINKLYLKYNILKKKKSLNNAIIRKISDDFYEYYHTENTTSILRIKKHYVKHILTSQFLLKFIKKK
jgi:ribosomal protein S7